MSHWQGANRQRQQTILTLTGKQRRHLRGLAHDRKPVVTIGSRGLSDRVVTEIEDALHHHELLKIKLPALPGQERRALLTAGLSQRMLSRWERLRIVQHHQGDPEDFSPATTTELWGVSTQVLGDVLDRFYRVRQQ